MANQFLAFVVPAGNGSGAALGVAAFDALKTIVVDTPLAAPFSGIIVIEASEDGVIWSPVRQITAVDERPFPLTIAAQFMRVTRREVVPGGPLPAVMGGFAGGITNQFFALPVPVADGVGAVVPVSTTGAIKSFQCVGVFDGLLSVEGSQDGINFDPLVLFTNGGQIPINFLGRFQSVRVRRAIGAGTATMAMGAQDDSGGGGGGGAVLRGTILAENEARSQLGTVEAMMYQEAYNFDDLTPANIQIRLNAIVNRSATAGAATFRVRIGGTIDVATDGTIRATVVAAAAANTMETNLGAAFVKPVGVQLVKVTGMHAVAAGTANIKGCTVSAG